MNEVDPNFREQLKTIIKQTQEVAKEVFLKQSLQGQEICELFGNPEKIREKNKCVIKSGQNKTFSEDVYQVDVSCQQGLNCTKEFSKVQRQDPLDGNPVIHRHGRTKSQTFSSTTHLKKQQKNNTGRRSFKCLMCQKLFFKWNPFRLHVRSHVYKKTLYCTICYREFNYILRLKQHQVFHAGKKSFKCLICNKVFSRLSHLETHQVVHTGEKQYKCQVGLCHKAFSQLSSLKRHQAVHSGEKPYKCQLGLCHKTFSRLYSLKTHQVVHTGEKPYKCQLGLCHKTFSRLYSLKTHQVVHTGEKPYKCHVRLCYKAFSQLSSLKRHQEQMHISTLSSRVAFGHGMGCLNKPGKPIT